jgi:hypothetical protein
MKLLNLRESSYIFRAKCLQKKTSTTYCVTLRKSSLKYTYSISCGLRHTLIESNWEYSIFFINTDFSKLPPYMNIGITRYYSHLGYKLPWVIVHLASLNNKLTTWYLLFLPTNVSKLISSRRIWSQMSSRNNVVYV